MNVKCQLLYSLTGRFSILPPYAYPSDTCIVLPYLSTV